MCKHTKTIVVLGAAQVGVVKGDVNAIAGLGDGGIIVRHGGDCHCESARYTAIPGQGSWSKDMGPCAASAFVRDVSPGHPWQRALMHECGVNG